MQNWRSLSMNWKMWFIHLSIFLMFLGFVLLVNPGNLGRLGVVEIAVIVGWFGLLFAHGVTTFNAQANSPAKADNLLGKPKRHSERLMLGEDGELVMMSENDEVKRKR